MATVDVKGVVGPDGSVHELYYKGDKYKVNLPLSNGQPTYGSDGQFLRTDGDGGTEWVNFGTPTDEQVEDAVTEWLGDHPEATTTVQDGAITKAKLADGVAEVLDDTGFYNDVTVETGTFVNTAGDSTTYYLVTVPKLDSDENQIDIFADYDSTTTPLTYAQKNLTTLTVNSSLDFHVNSQLVAPAVIHNGEVKRESTFDSLASTYSYAVYVGFDSNRVPHEYPINTTAQYMIDDGIVEASVAYYRLVTDGEARDVSDIGLSAAQLKVNPRMAMFTKSDGAICFLACDGRENIDEGLTPSELAQLMISKGAVQGWNLDGGGSTSMVICGSKINRNIDENGTADRKVRVYWSVGKKYSNPAVQKAFAQVGVEKQRLIKQLLTYISNAAAPVQNGKDPTTLDAGTYYINNAANVPTTSDDGFVQVFKKNNSTIARVYWYPYDEDTVWVKKYTGSAWSAWTRDDGIWDVGVNIPSGSNLNNYTSVGKYKVASETIAGNITNIPIERAGTLLVFLSNNSDVVVQVYFGGNGAIFNRRITLGETPSYGSWVRFTEVRTKTESVTTDANGIVTFSVGTSTAQVHAMFADGKIVLPFLDGTAWKGLVLSTSLQPVANTAVSLIVDYSIKTYINNLS